MLALINPKVRPNYILKSRRSIHLRCLISVLNLTSNSIEIAYIKIKLDDKTFSKRPSLYFDESLLSIAPNSIPPAKNRLVNLQFVIPTNGISKKDFDSVTISIYDQDASLKGRIDRVKFFRVEWF